MKKHYLFAAALLFCTGAFAAPAEAVAEAGGIDTSSMSYKMQQREDIINSVHVVGNHTTANDSVNILLRQFYMD